MASTFFDLSFSSVMPILTWCALPIYGAALGLALALLDKLPSLQTQKALSHEGLTPGVILSAQFLLFCASLCLINSFRGFEGGFFQGQMYLNFFSIKIGFFLSNGMAFVLLTAMPIAKLSGPVSNTPLGFSHWSLAPLLISFWLLLPLVTQLGTSLLLLELIGVVLIWALTSVTTRSNYTLPNNQTNALNLVYALIIFIWASGLSALFVLLSIGFATLEGSLLNFFSPFDVLNVSGSPLMLSDLLLTLVLMFKFFIGGGQFLLLAWYRFLPFDTLVFYLFFYYPAHLLIGTTMFAGFFIPALSAASGLILTSILIAAIGFLPHLGIQSSPSLTIAGSSFIGLSFMALALINL